MNKQFQILKWIYQNRENFPLKSGKIFQAYQETEEYDAGQNAFSELLSKLYKKELVDKVDYGTYELTEKGENKVESFLYGDSEEIVRPENYGDVVDELSHFFLEEKETEINDALLQGESFDISLQELERFNVELFEGFFKDNPESFMTALEEALSETLSGTDVPDYSIIPDLEWLDTPLNDAITSSNLGQPMVVSGIIKASEQVSKIVTSAVFECMQCGDRVEKEQGRGALKSPYKCDCGSKQFNPIRENTVDVIDLELSHRDDMETNVDARITGDPDIGRETQKELMTGTKIKALGIPELLNAQSNNAEKRDIRLKILDYQRSDKKKELSEIDEDEKKEVLTKIKASDDPFDAFAESIAPDLGNMELPRKCVTASLIGATDRKDLGRIHVGIISNPGTGKSDLQEWVSNHFEKTHKTEGKGGTGTGLTASAEQTNGGEWRLVAGKLVFADKGILQIDEFDKFEEGELTSLNTAMESGFFNVDKASVSAELPGRATVIATGNFTDTLDGYTQPYEMLPEKGEGLYDRFALLCAITESGEEAKDKIASNFKEESDLTEEEASLCDSKFTPRELRIFRHLAKSYNPAISRDAVERCREYEDERVSKGNEINGASNRPFVQLLKLTTTVAKANLREKANVEDAQKAIELTESCKSSLGLDLGESASNKLKQKKIQRAVRNYYQNLPKEEDGGVDEQDLIDRINSNEDIDPKNVENAIDSLISNGDYWRPNFGVVSKV